MAEKTVYLRMCRCKNKWRCQCLVPEKKKKHPPFNSGVKLGTRAGIHPKFYKQPLDAPSVGLYDPQFPECKKGISWTKELESKEFSATMGGKIAENCGAQSKLTTKRCGPGSHDIFRWPENVLEQPCKGVRKDVGFGTVPLQKDWCTSTTPGPGFIPYVHDPYYHLNEAQKKRATCVPSFEYDGLHPRMGASQKVPRWSLPCTTYNVKDPGSFQAFIEKQTGKRGPYDLLTGPRDASTIKGYWAQAKVEDHGDWPKALPGEIDKLFHCSNYFKGKWTTCPRFTKKPTMRMMLNDIGLCYKDSNHPGPATYEPKSPRKATSRKNCPFNSCVKHARAQPRRGIRPGPDRYRIKEKYGIPGHGWTWAFKSKVARAAFAIKQSYRNF